MARSRSHPGPAAKIGIVATVVSLLVAMLAFAAPGAVAQSTDTQVVYDDALQAPFQNWSWSSTIDFASTAPAVSGTAIDAELGAWAALYLGLPEPIPFGSEAVVEFSVYGETPGATLWVAALDVTGNPGPTVTITPTTGQWTAFSVDAAELGGFASIAGLWWQNGSGNTTSVHFDDISLIGADGVIMASAGPDLSVSLGSETITRTVVDPNSGADLTNTITFPHPISEQVYGMGFTEASLMADLDVPINRWGGNATSRYNHETGSGVIGADWFYMTDPGTFGSDHTFEDENEAAGAETLFTVPISGWVSKGTEPSCGYPLPQWAPMDLTQPHWLDANLICGNGQRGGEVVPGEPTNTSTAVDEGFVQDWVEELVATHGDAASGGVENYALDNEPNLWSHTHSDVRAASIGRTELIDRNQTYAAAVKAGDPTADVFGPVLWGAWTYFQTNAEFDNGQRPRDVPNFIADYLTSMSSASDAAGERLLDALAVHFYDDRSYGSAPAAYRMESTRSLWDPTFAPDDWWLTRDFVYGEGLAVIPRLQAQIDTHYPGTELAITEYSFGASDRIDGGLAQVDALGIFGREGVDVATLWDPWSEVSGVEASVWADKPVYWAYRLFRNADGNGERFGQTSLFAESANQSELSIYAAKRADGAITVVVNNKTNGDLTSDVDIPGVAGSATPYTWGGSGVSLSEIRTAAPVSVDGGFSHTFPALSATLFVITPDGATNPEVSSDPAVACANPTIVGDGSGSILGTMGDDIIVGTDGPDLIHGRGGNDIICGGRSIDTIYGGGGDDVIFGEGGSDRMYGGPGADILYGNSGSDRVVGGHGDDRIFGHGGQDRLAGQDGDDTIQGNDSSDWISGGRGADTLRGAKGKDLIYGGSGDDSLFGGDNTDYLQGGAGTDLADGQAGRDNPFVRDVSGCAAEVVRNC